MAPEYCPHCQAARNVRVTTSTRIVVDPDGKKRTVRTRTVHCEACGAFIRSQDEKEGEGG